MHIHRHCPWSTGARVPTQNWIHWYAEAQLLPGRTQAPMEKRDLVHGSQSLSGWPRTYLQASKLRCYPWIKQNGTCRILNFPNLHQLAEFTGHGSMLYHPLHVLTRGGGGGGVRLIIDFIPQNGLLHLKEAPFPPTSLYQHWHLLHKVQGPFKDLSY